MKSLFFHMEGYLNSLKQERDLIQKKTLLSSLFQRNKKIISKKRNSNFQVRKKKKNFLGRENGTKWNSRVRFRFQKEFIHYYGGNVIGDRNASS